MKAFECNGCGACCRRVKVLSPDWPTRADGACALLTQDNRCSIYETRPAACRVDDAKPAGMTRERWHQLNAEYCAKFQKEDGLG